MRKILFGIYWGDLAWLILRVRSLTLTLCARLTKMRPGDYRWTVWVKVSVLEEEEKVSSCSG